MVVQERREEEVEVQVQIRDHTPPFSLSLTAVLGRHDPR